MEMREAKLSDRIREVAAQHYVIPAKKAGLQAVRISVREMMSKFPASEANGRQSVFCSALEARSFWEPNGLRLDRKDGPPSGRGTSVTFHFHWLGAPDDASTPGKFMTQEQAERLAEQYLTPLRGLLKKEIQEMGGTDAFMRWVRSDEPTI